jgi:hypothetical protein
MLLFILVAGAAIQCTSQLGCTSVPYDEVLNLIRLGIVELVLEVGGYSYYRKKYKKDDE